MRNKLSVKIIFLTFIAIGFSLPPQISEAQPPPYCNPDHTLRGNPSDCINEETDEHSQCFQECYNAYCVVEPDQEDCERACAGCCTNNDADGDCNPGEIDNCPDLYNVSQSDSDLDLIGDICDNCPEMPNGSNGGTCTKGTIGQSCRGDSECGASGFCSKNQEDTDGNGIGDACDADTTISSLVGTKWDVFVMEFPICGAQCGGATVTFYEREGVIVWDDSGIEGLPFPYSGQISFNDFILFAISDLQETFFMVGWGVAIINASITIMMFSCGQGYCGLDYIIFGTPLADQVM